MISVIVSLLLTLRGSARSHGGLQLEILALHHQLQVLHRARSPRLRLTAADRLLWVWLAGVWNNWRTALVIVKPETVIAWHRRGFRLFLDVEEPPADRSADRPFRCARADSDDGAGQPAL